MSSGGSNAYNVHFNNIKYAHNTFNELTTDRLNSDLKHAKYKMRVH